MHPETIVIDFDSTFIQSESLEELARLALAEHPERESRLQQMHELTEQGMDGSMPFSEGLQRRLQLLEASRAEVKQLIEQLRQQVTPSFARARRFLQENAERVYILSSGFHELIAPVIADFGLKPENVLANRFLYDFDGRIIGCDLSNPLSQDQGKVKALTNLGLSGRVVVIGDGITDAELRTHGLADAFYAFTENVSRQPVIELADKVLPDFDAYLGLHDLTVTPHPLHGGKALILEGVHSAARKELERLELDVEVVSHALGEEELVKAIEGVTVLGIRSKTRVTPKVLEAAKDLLAVGTFCIGTNQVDLEACTQRGIAVFNAPYSNTRSVVELAIGEIIMLMRKTFERSQKLHRGQWDKSASDANEIRGKTLGIVGYGNIGSQLSVLAEALGMRVLFFDLQERLPLGNAVACRNLDDLLKRADVVSIHVDGRLSNRGLIGERELDLMHRDACLLNLSRGHVVDLDALAARLKSKALRGAAVDVFPDEPASRDQVLSSPLQGIPNVLLTPHVGGSTQEAQRNIGEFVSQRLSDYLQRGATVCSVNFPELQLPPINNARRLIHIHRNRPGKLAAISQLMAERNVNIEGQYLQTNDTIGYVIMDVDAPYHAGLVKELSELPDTIKVRALY